MEMNGTPALHGYLMPAEWEPHSQCWMGWPVRYVQFFHVFLISSCCDMVSLTALHVICYILNCYHKNQNEPFWCLCLYFLGLLYNHCCYCCIILKKMLPKLTVQHGSILG